jgi:putative transposase
MPKRYLPLVNGEIYHIYNRGLEKRPIFDKERDYSIFKETLFYYCLAGTKPKFSIYRKSKILSLQSTDKLVEIICFCLMPNHFHIMVKQVREGGISEFMRKFIHSYNKYRNVKYQRKGPIFQGVFKAVHVDNDEQLIHLSRYIHLNPLVSFLVKDLRNYPYSSFNDFVNSESNFPLAKDVVLSFFKSPSDYEQFVLDQESYGKNLERIKK